MIYNVLEKVKKLLEADSLINKVTQGDLFEVDLNKQTVFPLAHVMFNNATQPENIIRFDISVMFCDIIEEDDSNFVDVWNRTFTSAIVFVEKLRRVDNNFVIVDDVLHEPFRDRFTNKLGGFMTTVTIDMLNEAAIC
jgi:hypothetical protein